MDLIKDPSIFTESTLSAWRFLNEVYPDPKSSIATWQPSSLRVETKRVASSRCRIAAVSVISTVNRLAIPGCLDAKAHNKDNHSGSVAPSGETLMASLHSSYLASWSSAISSTRKSSNRTRPSFSQVSTNGPAAIISPLVLRTRNNAS